MNLQKARDIINQLSDKEFEYLGLTLTRTDYFIDELTYKSLLDKGLIVYCPIENLNIIRAWNYESIIRLNTYTTSYYYGNKISDLNKDGELSDSQHYSCQTVPDSNPLKFSEIFKKT